MSKFKVDEIVLSEEYMYLPTFPEPINGEISTKDFLTASKEMMKILDKFGNIFMPVKYNMQGNIEKLLKKFNPNVKTHSTVQKMLIEGTNEVEKPVLFEALLWLIRGLQMIQLFFQNIVSDYKFGRDSEDLVACVYNSYELTLEPHHGYVAQQLFGILCRMMPTRSEILRSIANRYDVNQTIIITCMDRFEKRLYYTLGNLNDFYLTHNPEDIEED